MPSQNVDRQPLGSSGVTMARSKQYLHSGCSSSWYFLILAQRAVEHHLSHFVGWPRGAETAPRSTREQLCVGALPLALDIASGQKDPALTTEQPEQDSDPITPCHAGVDREVIAERTA